MKPIAILIVVSAVYSARAVSLEGERFQPDAPIEWRATNSLPERMAVYKVVPQSFSGAVISNAMALGSFKPTQRIRTPDKGLLYFEDNRENMTRFLRIMPAQGWIRYHDNKAGGHPIRSVPSFEEVERLASSWFERLGGDVNELDPRPRPRSETTVTSFTRPGGQQISKLVGARWITMFRQIDGIDLSGKCFSIEFGNDARVKDLELSWRKLEPVKRYRTISKEQIMDHLKGGRAVIPPVLLAPPPAKALKVTGVRPWYVGVTEGVPQDTIYPVVNVDMVATDKAGSNFEFTVQCPAIAIEEPGK
jgi:hypothetical protein